MKSQLCILAALMMVSMAIPARAASERPSVIALASGQQIPIQREWVDEADPAAMKTVPMDQRPYRFNQRVPVHVATEERGGQSPVY